MSQKPVAARRCHCGREVVPRDPDPWEGRMDDYCECKNCYPKSQGGASAYVLVRFERDGVGYVPVEPIELPPRFDGPRWMKARIGITTREVWVDVSKAYLIEEREATYADA